MANASREVKDYGFCEITASEEEFRSEARALLGRDV